MVWRKSPERPQSLYKQYRLRAIGGAAVVNRLAYFYLEKRGARVTAASRQIARKRYSYSG
jgi:hypothetical protein